MDRRLRVASLSVIALTSAAAVPAQAQGARRPPIADNSFLVEEAYNQEAGVVQHISLFEHSRRSSAWTWTFTQEWPAGGRRHQVSATVAAARRLGGDHGVGDLQVNYRFQAVANDRAGTFVAPRLSVTVPTGDYRRELGSGAFGLQAALPVSQRLSTTFVAHSNVAMTFVPSARDRDGHIGSETGISFAQGVVWEAFARANVLLEATWAGTLRVDRAGREWQSSARLSPGVRWAYDFASGLQVVPGVAFPMDLAAAHGDPQLLIYLSFEHPFRAPR